MYVIFDCSQFISYDLVKQFHDFNEEYNDFIKAGFDVVFENDIELKKMDYVKDYLSRYTIELFDQEFIAEFDTWIIRDEIPERILKFGAIISKLVSQEAIRNFKIILVDTAPQEKEGMKIIEKEITLDTLYEGLFAASGRVFSGDIIIFSLKK